MSPCLTGVEDSGSFPSLGPCQHERWQALLTNYGKDLGWFDFFHTSLTLTNTVLLQPNPGSAKSQPSVF